MTRSDDASHRPFTLADMTILVAGFALGFATLGAVVRTPAGAAPPAKPVHVVALVGLGVVTVAAGLLAVGPLLVWRQARLIGRWRLTPGEWLWVTGAFPAWCLTAALLFSGLGRSLVTGGVSRAYLAAFLVGGGIGLAAGVVVAFVLGIELKSWRMATPVLEQAPVRWWRCVPTTLMVLGALAMHVGPMWLAHVLIVSGIVVMPVCGLSYRRLNPGAGHLMWRALPWPHWLGLILGALPLAGLVLYGAFLYV